MSWHRKGEFDLALRHSSSRTSASQGQGRGTSSRVPASAARAQPVVAMPAHEPADSPRDAHAGIHARVRGQWGRLAALYHSCETCTAQSERTVYKTFLRNLHLIVSDMEQQRADPNDVSKARSLVTVVRLTGADRLSAPRQGRVALAAAGELARVVGRQAHPRLRRAPAPARCRPAPWRRVARPST